MPKIEKTATALSKSAMPPPPRDIPNFPGKAKGDKVKPLPPKYLEISNPDGTTRTIENPRRIEEEAKRAGKISSAHNPVSPDKLNIISKGTKTPFVKMTLAQSAPIKQYVSEPHRFKAAVDSRSETKGVQANANKLKNQLMQADYSHVQSSRGPLGAYSAGAKSGGRGGLSSGHYDNDDESVGMGSVGSPTPAGMPKEFGTHYMNVPNAFHRPKVAMPKNAALPRPYVPHAKHFYDQQEKLAARTASGEVLGKTQARHVNAGNVPYTEDGYVPTAQDTQWQATEEYYDESPVGPDNPVKAYDAAGIWSACWDEEAEAVYYYNNENGEATWIPPPL